MIPGGGDGELSKHPSAPLGFPQEGAAKGWNPKP